MTMDLTTSINYAFKYLESLRFKVHANSGILLASSIIVLLIISLENTDIILASVDEPMVSTWTTYYN